MQHELSYSVFVSEESDLIFYEYSLYQQGKRMMVEISCTVGSSLSKRAVNLTVTMWSSERPYSYGLVEHLL